MLALLDEESKFPRATDLSFAEKLHKNFKHHTHYIAPKDYGPSFMIVHFAGPVSGRGHVNGRGGIVCVGGREE